MIYSCDFSSLFGYHRLQHFNEVMIVLKSCLPSQGFKNHRLHEVLDSPGSADLTADVDFAAIRRAVLPEGTIMPNALSTDTSFSTVTVFGIWLILIDTHCGRLLCGS